MTSVGLSDLRAGARPGPPRAAIRVLVLLHPTSVLSSSRAGVSVCLCVCLRRDVCVSGVGVCVGKNLREGSPEEGAGPSFLAGPRPVPSLP